MNLPSHWPRVLFGFASALAICVPAQADDSAASIRGLQFSTIGLDFKVDNLGAKVQSLEVKETSAEVHIELAADVLFDFDKATLLPAAQTALQQAAAVIRDKARGAVQIDGYTDSKGASAYNQKLSVQRANAVRDWFVKREGLNSVNFVTRGMGARNPVASNAKPDGSDDPQGRQKNRRVEITIKK
jgi:outer membrane protein OmpA-like peptidoglycan-associated protein